MIRPAVRPIAASLRSLGLFALVASGVVFADAAPPDFSDGRIVAGFDGKCASTEVFQAANLAPVIADALDRVREEYSFLWGDRAIRLDLNADGKPEHFVPLGCSGTGHCGWVVVGGSPPAVVGDLSGIRAIYVHEPTQARAWPVLTGVWSEGAGQGGVARYAWDTARKSYVESSSESISGIVYEAFLEGIGNPDCRIRTNLPAPGKATP